jgi:CRISPR-associated protein Cas5d
MRASSLFAVRMHGPYACFTRPEFKVERVSYDVLTPSAARGVLEAVFWRPEIRWYVEAIELHAPIKHIEIKRNEVGSRAHRPSVATIAGRAPYDAYYADDDRQQRHTVALRDVDYVVRARMRARRDTTPERLRACSKMFERRLARGQHFSMPYFGCREFECFVEPAPAARTPLPIDLALGPLLLDIDHGPPARPLFFDASLVRGEITVPLPGGLS